MVSCSCSVLPQRRAIQRISSTEKRSQNMQLVLFNMLSFFSFFFVVGSDPSQSLTCAAFGTHAYDCVRCVEGAVRRHRRIMKVIMIMYGGRACIMGMLACGVALRQEFQ